MEYFVPKDTPAILISLNVEKHSERYRTGVEYRTTEDQTFCELELIASESMFLDKTIETVTHFDVGKITGKIHDYVLNEAAIRKMFVFKRGPWIIIINQDHVGFKE